MSIFSLFQHRLEGVALDGRRTNSRSASVIAAENVGGDPLLGIQYSCDFRHEEEAGSGEMAQIFTRTADPESFFAQEYLLQENNKGLMEAYQQADLVFEDDRVIAFAAKTRIFDIDREIKEGLAYVRSASNYGDERWTIRQKYWQKTVAELKAELKSRGIKGYSKLNSKELQNLLIEADYAEAHKDDAPVEITSQPGWFHYGNILLFEKKAGLFTEVLQKLVEAAKAGQLVVGSGGIGAFGSGFSLFDGRDLTEEAREQISANNRWHREQMELLKPVAEVVKAGPMKGSWGSAYYFLGKPTIFDSFDGVVKYWLNGNSVKCANGRSVQPFGYYSLQELLDEKYMEDAYAKSDEDFKIFENGNYRKVKLTDEEAEAELKARGLRWASKPMASE